TLCIIAISYLCFFTLWFYVFFFFFFQAEDGIRDFHVTGVQTCALPIYRRETNQGLRCVCWKNHGIQSGENQPRIQKRGRFSQSRSEERRVGKECRSRWTPHH